MQPNQPGISLIAKKITAPITVDGNIHKQSWQSAAWSNRLMDMVTGAPGLYDTRTAVLWNDTHLYAVFWAEEPFLEAHQIERDSLIFLENDLELFIDGDGCCYELEINARNTVYEVFFIWRDAYQKGGRFHVPEFDVHQPEAVTFGGDYDRTGASLWRGTHPRGLRWAFLNYDMPGLETAVQLNGTLNNHTGIDRGWSLEIGIPRESLHWLADGRKLPPTDGDVWRMFLGRFQKLVVSGQEVQPHPAMVSDAHGIYDTHQPERWSRVLFQE